MPRPIQNLAWDPGYDPGEDIELATLRALKAPRARHRRRPDAPVMEF